MNTTALNQNTSYNSDITTASNGKVMRRKSAASLVLSLVILLAGIALLILASGLAEKTTAVYNLTLTLAVAAIGTGLGMFFWGGKEWVYMPTKSKITVQSKYINPMQFDAVCQAICMRDLSLLGKGLKTVEKSGVRIDLYTSADGEFTAAQTFQYFPFAYSPATPVCCAYGEHAKAFARLF